MMGRGPDGGEQTEWIRLVFTRQFLIWFHPILSPEAKLSGKNMSKTIFFENISAKFTSKLSSNPTLNHKNRYSTKIAEITDSFVWVELNWCCQLKMFFNSNENKTKSNHLKSPFIAFTFENAPKTTALVDDVWTKTKKNTNHYQIVHAKLYLRSDATLNDTHRYIKGIYWIAEIQKSFIYGDAQE